MWCPANSSLSAVLFAWSIICLPQPVIDMDIWIRTNAPLLPPVIPYIEFAMIFSASWREFHTMQSYFLLYFCASASSRLAMFLASNNTAHIRGSSPGRTSAETNRAPHGDVESTADSGNASTALFSRGVCFLIVPAHAPPIIVE